MKTAPTLRIFMTSLLTFSIFASSAFAQTTSPSSGKVTVQEMKSQLDRMSQAERIRALDKARQDNLEIRRQLAIAHAELSTAQEKPEDKLGGGWLFLTAPAFLGQAVGVSMMFQNGLGESNPRLGGAIFIGSSIVQAIALYESHKYNEKQKAIYLSKTEIIKAMNKIENLQERLEVESERIDLLRNFYGLSILDQ